LYAIVDPERCQGRDPVAVAEAILRGGCAMLQLRTKRASDRDRLIWMRALRERAHAYGVPFIVNDRPDLAVLASADGLHLGQDDVPIAEARKIVGSMPIGLSTHRESELRAAILAGADMIGFGPVFETKSKENPDATVGIAQLSEIVRVSTVPVVAIGGIDASNVALVRETGVPLSACISALGEADDPEAIARMLHRALGGTS
jgi:thiamine-phosphate pyrophosphorylase